MSKRAYFWFLEPLNEYTNQAIIKEELNEPAFSKELECENKKRRHLWECSFDLVSAFLESKKTDDRLGFRVFVKQDRGPIRQWKFPKKRKLQKIKKQ